MLRKKVYTAKGKRSYMHGVKELMSGVQFPDLCWEGNRVDTKKSLRKKKVRSKEKIDWQLIRR